METQKKIHNTIEQIKQIKLKRKIQISNFLSNKYVRWFLGLLITIGIVSTVLSSYSEMIFYRKIFNIISYISAFIFTIEFSLRLYAAPLQYNKEGIKRIKGRLLYLTSFMGVIDFFAIFPFTIPFLFPDNETIRQAIEFGRIVIIFKLFRYSRSFQTIQDVLASIKYELLTTLFLIGVIMSFCAIMMYFLENKAQPDAFRNMGDGFWWSIVTITTIGYGDIYPVTLLGRILAGSMSIIGLIIFAIPTALVSGAYIRFLEQGKDHKKGNKQ